MRKGRGRPQGFTLIELLVSLAIFSVISLAVYSSFAAGIRAWRRAQEFSSVYQTARLLLDDMAQELKNAAAIPDTNFVGEAHRLSFVTLRQNPPATGRAPYPRVTRVTYELSRDRASPGYSLFRLEAPDIKSSDSDGGGRALIVGSISRFDFQYTHKDSKGEILPWKDAWDASDLLPLGVKITLMIGETRFTKTVFIPHGFQEKEDKRKG